MPTKSSKDLLTKWEEVYKKGLLSFWLLLLLHERSSYPYEIGQTIRDFSQNTISADENSIYRALNRFEALGVVSSALQPSDSGPARRYYHLTQSGNQLLADFIRRNILIFSTPSISERIQAVLLDSNPQEEAQ
jgi:PadR family transcriptional regulator, regulatory protein PadR